METSTAGVVEISVMGGDDYKLDFVKDKTVGEYLNDAGIDVADGQSVSLNGEKISDFSQMVSPEGQIVVASQVANG